MIRSSTLALVLLFGGLVALACTLSLFGVPPISSTAVTQETHEVASPTFRASALPSSISTEPPLATSATAITPPPISFCAGEQPRELISHFQSAIVNSDGPLLGSLISPTHGMDARLFRNGRVVNYDRKHAAALFESTFDVNWGIAPGSGLDAVGSFKDLLVPDLLDVLTRDFQIDCNSVRVGGTTYDAHWPYSGIDFYALFFPGTQEYGNMDWHTWILGMQFSHGNPYLYAIMQFKWEP